MKMQSDWWDALFIPPKKSSASTLKQPLQEESQMKPKTDSLESGSQQSAKPTSYLMHSVRLSSVEDLSGYESTSLMFLGQDIIQSTILAALSGKVFARAVPRGTECWLHIY